MINIFKALSEENRLRIVNLLIKRELCVCEIETILNMSQSNVSRHLSKLKSTNLILANKDAQWVHYKLNEDFAKKHSELISYLKKQLSQLEIYVHDLKVLNNYLNSGLNCTDIRCCKESVIKAINNGG